MPTITYHRFWCSKCKDFTLHDTYRDKGCRICGTVTKTYNLSEVPEEKKLQQQERYKNSKTKGFSQILGTYLNPKSMMDELFSEDYPEPEIIETDAGYKQIEEANRQAWAKKEEQLKAHQQEAARYNLLNRNDICLCGTGKKYKNCCWMKYN